MHMLNDFNGAKYFSEAISISLSLQPSVKMSGDKLKVRYVHTAIM